MKWLTANRDYSDGNTWSQKASPLSAVELAREHLVFLEPAIILFRRCQRQLSVS
jgi:hypothetical protein